MTGDKKVFGTNAKRWTLIIAVVALLASAGGWWALKQGRPWLYGVEAYVYGFPLIMMDLTKDVSTAVPTAGEFTAPVNQFSVMTRYPDASFKAVARTGLDTLFAVAWADLDKEPLLLSVPDTKGRYYVIALFDMWSNVFASIGKRTTGTGAANFLIAGPGWHGTPPAGVKQTFRSPTRFVWVNGQMQANGPQGLRGGERAAEAIQADAAERLGQASCTAAEVPVAAGVDATTPPLEQVQKMDAGAYFGRLARLMKDNPPAPADAPMVEKLKTLGIEPGQGLRHRQDRSGHRQGLAARDGCVRNAAEGRQEAEDRKRLDRDAEGLGQLRHRLRDPRRHRSRRTRRDPAARRGLPHGFHRRRWQAAGWRQPLRPAFRQGPDAADQRHMVGLDVRPATASTCPTPSTATISRHGCRSSTTPTARSTCYIQANSPGADKEANWLPAPASGPFNLTVRDYWPKEAMIDGSYKLPPVRKLP